MGYALRNEEPTPPAAGDCEIVLLPRGYSAFQNDGAHIKLLVIQRKIIYIQRSIEVLIE